MWDKFITGFCKVEFLCYAGDPNWLGVILLLLLFGAILYMTWRVAIFLAKFIHGRLGNPYLREYLIIPLLAPFILTIVFSYMIGVVYFVNFALTAIGWIFGFTPFKFFTDWGLPFLLFI
jgi:hypothetical protein